MNKENKQRLINLETAHLKEKYPSMPEFALAKTKWADSSANALTKSVVSFINLSGYQAERINTTGMWRQGAKLKVGEGTRQMPGKWTKGTGTKGSADISATINGRSVKIEIKYGKDRQSEAQIRYQEMIEKAGGTYLIVKSFDDFIQWFDLFISKK
jgi:V8-like Glu-specific endopeptidase